VSVSVSFRPFFSFSLLFFYLKSFTEDFHPWQIDAVTGVVQVLVHAILSGHSGLDYSCLLCYNTVFFGLEMTDVSNLLNGKGDGVQDVFRDMPNWLFKLLETGMALVVI